MEAARLQLMTRKACCLCEDAERIIQQLASEGLCTFTLCDVDEDVALAARYGMDVPVLLHDGQRLMQHRIDAASLRDYLLHRPKE